MRFVYRITKARMQTHTLPIFNIYWFSTAAVLREHASMLRYTATSNAIKHNTIMLCYVMLQICELVSVINTAFSLLFLTHTLLSQT